MKTQFALALAIVISAPVFSQTVKVAADQKTSAASSVNGDRNRLATSTSAQNSGSLNIEKSNESNESLRASGNAALKAKQEVVAKGKEEADKSSAVYVSSNGDADARTRVQADESRSSSSANGQVKLSAKADPASTINAGTESTERIYTNVQAKTKAESLAAVKIAATESASAKNSIDGKIGTAMKSRSNINAVQSNTVKLKPVSVHSRAMASSKIRL